MKSCDYKITRSHALITKSHDQMRSKEVCPLWKFVITAFNKFQEGIPLLMKCDLVISWLKNLIWHLMDWHKQMLKCKTIAIVNSCQHYCDHNITDHSGSKDVVIFVKLGFTCCTSPTMWLIIHLFNLLTMIRLHTFTCNGS